MTGPAYQTVTDKMQAARNRFLLALQFLTILPVRRNSGFSEEEMPRSAVFFPAVGAMQGGLAAGAAYLAASLFTPGMAGVLTVLAVVLTNGGFHLDGLADTFDALAVKTTGEREADLAKRLAVMKDSASGAVGVAAITLALLMKCLLVSDIIADSASAARYSFLFLFPLFSKWAMVPAAYHGVAARKDGLGRLFIEKVRTKDLILASVLALLVALAALDITARTFSAAALPLFPLFATLYLFSLGAAKFCRWRFGGITGDSLGAIGEIAELIFLMAAFLWLRHSI